MKKRIITLFAFILCVYISNAQSTLADDSGDEQNFDVQKELERQVQIPNTPEAQAFEKYGNTSVSLYTGTPNISIPIYTIPGRELSLPISLTYDASGVKVSQMASQAGLSWNLNVGGRISRTVNGLVDDYISSTPGYLAIGNPNNNSDTVLLFNGGGSTGESLRELVEEYKNTPSSFESLAKGEQYFNFLKDLSENRFDTQPDYFSFNALGYSDTFVLDVETNTFVALKNPRTKVTAIYSSDFQSLDRWEVTTDNGTKFYFEDAEITEKQSDPDSGSSIPLQTYNSSWVLTRVVSALGKDVYEFHYHDIETTDNEAYHIGSAISTPVFVSANDERLMLDYIYTGVEYNHRTKILKSITYHEDEVVNILFKTRWDLKLATSNSWGLAVDAIQILKPNSGDILKQIRLNHSYFGILSNENPESYKNTPYKIRLKLDGIDLQSVDPISNEATTLNSYGFEYIQPQNVPSRSSLGQDYLGLNNGASGNSVLYVADDDLDEYAGVNGANRNPNFEYATKGLLEKITYPTGGYSIFNYEPHDVKVYNSFSNTVNVTYANLGVSGGIVNENEDCGNCCIDQYGNPPNIQSLTFRIDEADTYKMDYTEHGIVGEAFLLKIADVPEDNAAIIPYASIINQLDCNEQLDLTWANYYSNRSSIYLERGTYQLTALKETGTISVRIHREEPTDSDNYLNVTKAGIRIKTIIDYSDENTLASEKEYLYIQAQDQNIEITEMASDFDDELPPNDDDDSHFGGFSSGVELFKPNFIIASNFRTHAVSFDGRKRIMIMNRFTRPTSFSGGDRPHVAYSRVLEIQKDGDQTNGYTDHRFNVGAYNGVSTDLGVNYYRSDFKTAKESNRQIFNTAQEKQAEEKTDYKESEYFSYGTMYPHSNPENGLHSVVFQETSQGIWRYEYVSLTDQISDFGPAVPQFPRICNNPSAFCLDFNLSTLDSRQTYAQGKTGGLLKKENSQFFADNIITTTTNYSYYDDIDSNPNYLLKTTETTDSNGDILKEELHYPSVGSPLYNANVIIHPIKTQTYKNSDSLFYKETIYDNLLPSMIVTAKGASDPEARLIFEKYKHDNLVQAKQADGTPTSYIWGYDRKYIVAKIENATYAQIEELDVFGENFNITENLSNAQITALRNLSNTLVTSYTYDPLIGVTSITDPRGRTVYYEYDEFNRLEFVKDHEGKIVNENQYYYKN